MSDVVEKSANDERQYRALKLKNGLRVLLVHDAETRKPAAALAVFQSQLYDSPII